MVHNVNVSSAPAAIRTNIKSEYPTTTGIDKPVQNIPKNIDTASVSTLSRQLGESAVRAEVREKSMTWEQLGEYSKKNR